MTLNFLRSAAVLLFGSVAFISAHAQVLYHAAKINIGDSDYRVTDLNDFGQVSGFTYLPDYSDGVGSFTKNELAFIADGNGSSISFLDNPSNVTRMMALEMNNSGQVVGRASSSDVNAPEPSWVSFTTGAFGQNVTVSGAYQAVDVNDAGTVAGITNVGGQRKIYIQKPEVVNSTQAGGRVVDSNNPVIIEDNSGVVAINNIGQVLSGGGVVYDDAGDVLATVGNPFVGFSNYVSHTSYFTGMNGSGVVTGFADVTLLNNLGVAYIEKMAFRTQNNAVGVSFLGTLGGLQSYAIGVNDSGLVVGSALNAYDQYRAFVAGTQGMVDLNTLLLNPLSSSTQPGSLYLEKAIAVNSAGQILAVDWDGAGYLLTPEVPENGTYALMLVGLLMVGAQVSARKRH